VSWEEAVHVLVQSLKGKNHRHLGVSVLSLADMGFVEREFVYHPFCHKTKLLGLSPRANYTDRATTACRRSDCQLLRIEGATWSA
jgi:hypothetical protein